MKYTRGEATVSIQKLEKTLYTLGNYNVVAGTVPKLTIIYAIIIKFLAVGFCIAESVIRLHSRRLRRLGKTLELRMWHRRYRWHGSSVAELKRYNIMTAGDDCVQNKPLFPLQSLLSRTGRHFFFKFFSSVRSRK